MGGVQKRRPLIVSKLESFYGAEDRGRTGTGIATHGILSPGRLPIPPLRRG